MRAPAALVAIPLTIGCALGMCVGERVPALFAACAAMGACLALLGSVSALAWGDDGTAECTACVIAGALVVGVSLGADAAIRAYRTPLVAWFEARHPLDGLTVLHGRLREDAS